MPSSFRVGAAAQATIAASGLAAAELWRMRGGTAQQVAVDMRHAAVEFHSEGYFRLENGGAPRIWDKIAGVYQCGDGRWVRIHTNFPHHRDGILELLGSDYSREAVDAALQEREADDFVEAASGRGLIAAMMRTPEEWAARRLTVNPTLRLLAFQYSVNAYLDAVHRDENPRIPEPRASWVAVYRTDDIVRRTPYTGEQYATLLAIKGGEPLGDALEHAGDDAGQVGDWFRDWGAAGLFVV